MKKMNHNAFQAGQWFVLEFFLHKFTLSCSAHRYHRIRNVPTEFQSETIWTLIIFPPLRPCGKVIDKRNSKEEGRLGFNKAGKTNVFKAWSVRFESHKTMRWVILSQSTIFLFYIHTNIRIFWQYSWCIFLMHISSFYYFY